MPFAKRRVFIAYGLGLSLVLSTLYLTEHGWLSFLATPQQNSWLTVVAFIGIHVPNVLVFERMVSSRNIPRSIAHFVGSMAMVISQAGLSRPNFNQLHISFGVMLVIFNSWGYNKRAPTQILAKEPVRWVVFCVWMAGVFFLAGVSTAFIPYGQLGPAWSWITWGVGIPATIGAITFVVMRNTGAMLRGVRARMDGGIIHKTAADKPWFHVVNASLAIMTLVTNLVQYSHDSVIINTAYVLISVRQYVWLRWVLPVPARRERVYKMLLFGKKVASR